MRVLFCAFAFGLAPVAASAGSYADVAPLVSIDAFSDADADWRRYMTQQKAECGYFGRQREQRRVDVLIERYTVLADAVESGDEAAAMAAGKTLYLTIDQSDRFNACWSHIARKAGVPSRLKRTLRNI